jgi:hypothetical protein
MHDPFDTDPDSPERLLGPRPAAPDPALRQALLRRTLAVLRRRVWLKRLAVAAGLAACFAGGYLTSRLTTTPQTETRFVVVERGQDRPVLPEEGPGAPVAEARAAAVEDRAITSPMPRPDLYRQAGDLYLNAEGDVQAALRCYRLALDAGSDKDLAVAPEDNWLLSSLKEARQREKVDAKINE